AGTEEWKDHAFDTRLIIDDILEATHGLDLVGIWTAGPVFRGFASSTGQRNWYQRSTFLLDFSCFLPSGRAVKQRYCDQAWSATAFRSLVRDVRAQLQALDRPAMTIKPGEYRTYLAPTALTELFAL